MRSDELAIEVIKGLMQTLPQIDPQLIDDVIVGNAVPEAEQGLNGRPFRILQRTRVCISSTVEVVRRQFCDA